MQYLETTDPVSGISTKEGIRDGNFVIQGEIDATGFEGMEELNWEQMETLTPQ